MKKSMSLMLGDLLMGGLLVSGCSSGLSEGELKQLDELKAEVASLERQVQDLLAKVGPSAIDCPKRCAIEEMRRG